MFRRNPQPPSEFLSAQESVLASVMLRQRIGNAGVHLAHRKDDREPTVEQSDEDSFSLLAAEFRRDPKTSLARVRESLIAISQDKQLSKREKSKRLDQYLSAYTDLTLKLDHEAFPPSQAIHMGLPEYIPDGFIDMGGSSSVDPQTRRRELIKVDKATILERYAPLLKEVFGGDYEGHSSDEKKGDMIEKLYWGVRREITYNAERSKETQGMVNLGEVSEGVCRHIALTFQVLAQAAGLTSRLLKCDLTMENEEVGTFITGRHAANLVSINHKWYLLDVTSPDYTRKKNGTLEGWLGVMSVDRPPMDYETKEYSGVMQHSNRRRSYTSRYDSYWFIDQQ